MRADIGPIEVLSVIFLSHKSAEATSSPQPMRPIKRPMFEAVKNLAKRLRLCSLCSGRWGPEQR